MKITVIVPTGEVRKAISGEYVLSDNKWWPVQRHSLWSETDELYHIAHAHEVEMPDGATELCIESFGGGWTELATIPLPRKKKVKKWQWVIECLNSLGDANVPYGHYTEEEIKNTYPHRGFYHKVPETIIEVEE